MVYTSLTEAPHNLKEAIDWLMALKGTDAAKNMAAIGDAIHKFLVDKPVGFTEVPALGEVKLISKEFMEKPALRVQPFVKLLLERFSKPLDKSPGVIAKAFGLVPKSDYENVVQTRGTKPEAIAKNLGKVVDGCEKFLEKMKISDHYNSAYSSGATWDASCAKDPEACAVVLVGIAPMLYTGLGALRDACNEEALKYMQFNHRRSTLGEVLEAVGYKEPDCRAGMSTSGVTRALRGVNREILNIIYDLAGFWAFYGKNKSGAVRAVEPVKPTQEEQSVKPVEPVEHPAEPVEAEQPAEAIEPVEPVQEGQSAGVEEPVKAEEPVKVVKAAKSVKAAKKAAKKVAKKARQKKNRTQNSQ
ncbi:hypothetical protein, conserved [Babesia ovata]|uniref:Uncharacterized protein n=1 Tax=Babesia ovata TaxID=189622 RepID=A0A2H6KCI6_9APIC|nr:uncharacterized protein BOVATA_022060 [Babesia ovata]GBE60713.1 hypothetical protein, conserved [Babesia ovata]